MNLSVNTEERFKKIENEIEQINSRINTIVKSLEDLIKNEAEKAEKWQKELEEFTSLLASSVEAMSIIRYYDSKQEEIDLEKLEGVLSCLQRINEIHRQTENDWLKAYALEREQLIFGAFLELAKHKKIDPGEILSHYLEEFGKDNLREIVRIEDVLDTFGTDEALRWKRLLKLKI